MSENKKYYWLKLKKDFFESKMIKILRTFEKGNEMILTFLKIELHSLVNDGYVYFENMLPSFEQELAVAIDENIDIVKLTVETLLKFGAIKKIDENTYYLTIIEDCIGSESSSANRVRKHRNTEKCNDDELQCNAEMLHCNTEIEKEKSKSKSKSRDREDKKTSAFSLQKKAEVLMCKT
ncbi:MAG: phage replisome organizer N-terminal domain-containing protein [Clostridia bacterium]|nr:phage replisome organizer N-terminal domain-containing protein [Clostridia bacterium]